MSSKTKQILQYSLSFLLGLALMYFVFRNEDIGKLWNDIKNANYYWIAATYLLTLVAHYTRAYRWNLLIKETGQKIANGEAFLALLAGYGANLILPRMGELTRCAVLKKRQHVAFDTALGTVVAERLFDFICLVVLLIATVIWQYDVLFNFIQNILSGFLSSKESLYQLFYMGLAFFAISIALFFILRKRFLNFYSHSENKLVVKIRSFVSGLGEGVYSIYRMPNKEVFLLATIVIWLCYYFMAYLIFFALPSTSELAMGAGVAILVMGAFGIAAPVQGGIGAYHWIVSQTLLLYGISETNGKTYAALAHASQMAFTIAFSLVCFAIIVLKKTKPNDRE
jgi:glycosyltransferase 2 family protein